MDGALSYLSNFFLNLNPSFIIEVLGFMIVVTASKP
jgi:hypothetical protein